MDTPFGIAWEHLELHHLRAFLADGPDESLTWEAKGSNVRPEHVRRTICAFANSDLGGYLVLGVSRDGPSGPWRVGGWTPTSEPSTWVEDCLANGGVRPRPSIDVRPWPINDGPERVAVVAIRPVAMPPALTAAGEVLVRLSGSSHRVTDPVRSDPDQLGSAVSLIGRDPTMLLPIWTTLNDLAMAIGAPSGSPTSVAIWLTGKGASEVSIRRSSALAEPTADELASIAREARRANGEPAWEPDGPPQAHG
jgi:hypothetical protein